MFAESFDLQAYSVCVDECVVVSGYARLSLFNTVPSLDLAENEAYRFESGMCEVVRIVRAPATDPATMCPSSIAMLANAIYSSCLFTPTSDRLNIRQIK